MEWMKWKEMDRLIWTECNGMDCKCNGNGENGLGFVHLNKIITLALLLKIICCVPLQGARRLSSYFLSPVLNPYLILANSSLS